MGPRLKGEATHREKCAQYRLGRMYESGDGVPKDDKEAVNWYRLAADRGDAYTQYRLGFTYEWGKSVSESKVMAHVWVNLATAMG